jgi:hypothetical protein
VADQTRCLCIVSRDRLFGRDFLAAVQASVRPEDHLEVVVDRRRGEPSSQWHGAEDRRKRPHVDRALQANGIAIVAAAVPGDERRPEPSLRDQTSSQPFEDRVFGREIPQNERSVNAERGPRPLGVQSWLDSRVTTAPEDFQNEPYADHDDDDAERLESILSFKRERSRRLLLPWIVAGLAVVAAVVVVLSPLAHSLKQSVAPRASSEVSPRATDPAAGAEPLSLSSRDDASAASPRDNREPSAESSAPPAPQTATGTTAGRRARSSVNEPAPRQTASAPPRSEPVSRSGSEPVSRSGSEPVSRLTSPRFAGMPSVDVSREPGSPTGIYSARIVDPAGRPLGDADVLLLARMSDGTVENVRMEFSPDRGTFRGALPPTRSSLVDLRVRVITGDKRIEIPVGP